MPPAVAALAAAAAASATAAGATAATAAFVSGAVTVGANLAIGMSLGFVANAIRGKPPQPKPSTGLTEFQQPIPPRFWHYGRVKLAGPLAFFEDWQPNGVCAKVILISSREIDGFEEHYLDDRTIAFSFDPEDNLALFNVNNRYEDASGENKAAIHVHLGTDSQLANEHLMLFWPDSVWSSDHRLRGIAYAVTVFADGDFYIDDPSDEEDLHQAIYPNGIPNYKALIRGSKLYDPRLDTTTGGSGSHLHADKSTWEWSENACLAVLDFLTHEDGYDIAISRLDVESFRIFADFCDDNILLADGVTTEKRWRVATTVYMNEPRTNVLARLLDVCDAHLYPTATGQLAIVAGGSVFDANPEVTIDADVGHVLEARLANGVPAMERYNEIAFQYRSPDHGFAEVEGDPWRNEADIASTGRILTRSFDWTAIPSHAQARRRAKIQMARDNPEWIGEIRTNFYGLNAIGERSITFVWSELDIGAFMLVDDIRVLEDGTGVAMNIRSSASSAYAWDAATEEGTAPAVPADA